MPGVRIEDMGHKMGCNGVDNGKLWFDGVHTSSACIPLLIIVLVTSQPSPVSVAVLCPLA